MFLEFALFVQRLREGHRTLWLQNLQNEGELISLDVLLQLQKSGKMVGEALRQIELSEKEVCITERGGGGIFLEHFKALKLHLLFFLSFSTS